VGVGVGVIVGVRVGVSVGCGGVVVVCWWRQAEARFRCMNLVFGGMGKKEPVWMSGGCILFFDGWVAFFRRC